MPNIFNSAVQGFIELINKIVLIVKAIFTGIQISIKFMFHTYLALEMGIIGFIQNIIVLFIKLRWGVVIVFLLFLIYNFFDIAGLLIAIVFILFLILIGHSKVKDEEEDWNITINKVAVFVTTPLKYILRISVLLLSLYIFYITMADKIYFKIGNMYFEEGKTSKAIDYYEKAIEINPEYFEAYLGLGYCYDKTGEYMKVIKECKKFIELNKDNYVAYFLLGRAYLMNKNYKESISIYHIAITKKRKNHHNIEDLYSNLALLYYKIKDFDNSIKFYKKIPQSHSLYMQSLYNTGECYFYKTKYQKALEYYKKALIVAPNNKTIQKKLKQVEEIIKDSTFKDN